MAEPAFESLGLRDVTLRYVSLGLILGFPFTLVFAWRYDLTAAGIVRTPALADGEKPDLSLRRVDYVRNPRGPQAVFEHALNQKGSAVDRRSDISVAVADRAYKGP